MSFLHGVCIAMKHHYNTVISVVRTRTALGSASLHSPDPEGVMRLGLLEVSSDSMGTGTFRSFGLCAGLVA